MIICVTIICVSRGGKIILSRHIPVNQKIQICFSCHIRINTIQLVSFQFIFLFTKFHQCVCINVTSLANWICVCIHISSILRPLDFSFAQRSAFIIFSCFCHTFSFPLSRKEILYLY